MKPTRHFVREVRRARHLDAWVKVEGRTHCECQVLDISKHGAKIRLQPLMTVPDRFHLAFFPGDLNRICEVVWRRGMMAGI